MSDTVPPPTQQPPTTTPRTRSRAMPELVDLPPELIERIYIDVESLIYQDLRAAGEETKSVAPIFRLTNRYIEQCTRRQFARRYFSTWRIPVPDDANIQKFCAMSEVPDLAACVFELILYFDDDSEMCAQQMSTLNTTKITVSDAEDVCEDACVLAPPAYVRNRDDLIEALSSCSNIGQLTFHPMSEEHDPKISDEDQAEGSLSRREPKDENFDVSSSFAYFLSLAEEAGLWPGWISMVPDCARPGNRGCSLTDCSALENAGDVLDGLQEFCIWIYLDRDELEDDAAATGLGLRLGRQLQVGLSHMPVLKSLSLTFEYGDAGKHVWDVLAKAPKLPMLEEFELICCTVNVHDFTSFVLKHITTLKQLQTSWVGLFGLTRSDISRFYADLSKASRLENFRQFQLSFGKYDDSIWPKIPNRFCYPRTSGEEVDDFVEIEVVNNLILWKGRDEVKGVLADLAGHFWTQ